MKQAVITKPQTIEFRDIPIPTVTPQTVLVKIDAVGLCTWEQKFFQGVPGSYPFVGGHEICGTIVEIGEKVAQNLSIGDRVAVASLTRCGECYYCRNGMDNLCSYVGEESHIGDYWGPGGFSEYFLAQGYEIFKLDQSVEAPVGTLAEPLACVIRSIDRGAVRIGDVVVITGAGVMGILHVMLAKASGATIIVSEVDELRRERARSFGADFVVNPLKENLSERVKEITNGIGAEAVFFTAGGKAALLDGISSLAKNGKLIVYGATTSSDVFEFDPKLLHYDEIYLTGVTKHTKDTFRRATQLLSDSSLQFERLVSKTVPFSDIQQGFSYASSLDTYRIVVHMG